MSNRNAFRAAGKEIVASVCSTTPPIDDASSREIPQPVTQQRGELFLKSPPNGHTPHKNGNGNGNGVALITPATKKACWADEEEDELFLAQFTTQPKQSAVASLETVISVKEGRVKELEATLSAKALRVAELEGAVQERDAYIEDLESNIQKKNDEIEGLKKKNHEQYVEIQELHREVLGKNDHITRIEAELEQVSTTQDIKTPTAHTDIPTKSDEVEISEKEKADTDESTVQKIVSVSSETTDTRQSEESLSTTPGSTESENSIDSPKTQTTCGPSFSDASFPVFVTKETLKSVPSAPKPKTLSFPIDLSKYGKKPTASPTVKPAQSPTSMTGMNGHTTPYGQSSKQTRVKTNIKPTFNPSADIRNMSHSERVLYANGPDVAVKLGDAELKTIAQYILMQCSAKAMQYFSANPNATSWNFPAGSMDADAAKSLLVWMDEMTYQARVYSISLFTSPTYDQRNIRICRAARVMGLNNCYVGHFTKQLCDRIRSKDVSYVFMDTVCEHAYPENDPVFDCLANNIANQKMSGNADRVTVEKLVTKYPVLKTKLDKIELKIRASRARK